jgi:uncharacterized protein DUF3306
MTDRDNSSEGFLDRWSRKKIEAEREARHAPIEVVAKDEPPPEGATAVARPTENKAKAPESPAVEPAFDIANLPSLDSITAATDMRPFLAPGVPKELARAALRRAWSADPAVRDFVGLAENAWDFTAPDALAGFGELQPGYDIKKIVAQIFSDGEKTPEASSPTNAQNTPKAAVVTEDIASPESVGADTTHSPSVASADQQPTTSIQSESNIVHRNNIVATRQGIPGDKTTEVQNKRQHGGALPK